MERKYFTDENNDIIYNRLKNELTIQYLPYLGPSINFGLGDICLEEDDNIFKFYVIDRASKFEYEEFNKVEDAIKKLATVTSKTDEDTVSFADAKITDVNAAIESFNIPVFASFVVIEPVVE